MPTAILIDGGFFVRRYRHLRGPRNPVEAAAELHRLCISHLNDKDKESPKKRNLYRIFYYDCPPLTKKAHNPVSSASVDFSKTPRHSTWRIIRRAKLTPWPKVFQNLSSTRQTKLDADCPSHDVGYCMGNAEKMAANYYLQ